MLNKILIASLLVIPSLAADAYKPVPVNPREVYCLKEALWHEARGESKDGIRAVAKVIQNRVYSGVYPKSYCGVVREYKQFSYVLQRKAKRLPLYPIARSDAEENVLEFISGIAAQTVMGVSPYSLPDDAMWYHTVKVKPKWRKNLQFEKIVGAHKFYSEK